MRSTEGRGGTLDGAVADALQELGVQRSQVTIEILDEDHDGTIRVRVTLREGVEVEQDQAAAEDAEATATRSDPEARDEDGSGEPGGDEEPAPETPEERMKRLDQEADIAADFMEGLLDLLDLPGDIEIEVTEDQAIVTVQDVGSGLLIGRRGATLDALQEIVRCAVQRSTQRRSHVRVDVEGYRARQLDKLRDKCRDAIAEVRETGHPVRLEPMDAYERKMMHDLAAAASGVTSASEGNEPRRRVVIRPA